MKIFCPLITSADSCSFLFLSIYHLSSSPFFSNYCNFMWFIICGCERVWAVVRGCTRVCTGVRMCVQVYMWCGCVWVYIHVRGWVWVGACVRRCVRYVQAGVHGCVWKSAEVRGCLRVCVLDEFSEYLLGTRVNTSADFNTYPIRIFFLPISTIYPLIPWFISVSKMKE